MSGFTGKILEINLTTKETSVEQPNQDFYRDYMGGRNIGAYYLLKKVPQGINPFHSDNLLIFTTSVLTGAPFPGNSRYSIVSKSPLTGGYGESEAGGHWGPELKRAGFDAIIVMGEAKYPVYINLKEGEVSIHDAQHLWGCDTRETQEIIWEEIEDEKAKILCIGQAGENLVRYASVASGLHDMHGRMGLGAVMGSKKLKAIVVRGSGEIEMHDQKQVREIAKWFSANFRQDATNRLLRNYGTAGGVGIYNELGSLPSYNFQKGTMSGAENLSGEKMKEQGLMIGKSSCFGCPVACRKTATVRNASSLYYTEKAHSPEYESIASLGTNCGITNPKAVIKTSDLCDRYGMDTISTGVTISFLMECYEKGLVKKRSPFEDFSIEFGNEEKLIQLITNIAYREGVGDVLAEGVKRLSEKLDEHCNDFAMHSKGEEIALQEPRAQKIGAALGYAVAPNGGDHIQMEHDFQFETQTGFLKSMSPFGVYRPVGAMNLDSRKVNLFTLNQKIWSLYNVLDLCIFTAAPGHTFKFSHINELVRAVTGWDSNAYELLQVGEKGLTMARCFNLREGFTVKDDAIPKRFYQPLKNGSSAGNFVDNQKLMRAIKLYYEMMGWNRSTGIPTDGTLARLGLEWVRKHM